ncbi:hypothetical protein J6590_057117 [Homalodisca vitripennis]|nr:hypothetical protein J6590_057117 [Homalodisca vitripennis]
MPVFYEYRPPEFSGSRCRLDCFTASLLDSCRPKYGRPSNKLIGGIYYWLETSFLECRNPRCQQSDHYHDVRYNHKEGIELQLQLQTLNHQDNIWRETHARTRAVRHYPSEEVKWFLRVISTERLHRYFEDNEPKRISDRKIQDGIFGIQSQLKGGRSTPTQKKVKADICRTESYKGILRHPYAQVAFLSRIVVVRQLNSGEGEISKDGSLSRDGGHPGEVMSCLIIEVAKANHLKNPALPCPRRRPKLCFGSDNFRTKVPFHRISSHQLCWIYDCSTNSDQLSRIGNSRPQKIVGKVGISEIRVYSQYTDSHRLFSILPPPFYILGSPLLLFAFNVLVYNRVRNEIYGLLFRKMKRGQRDDYAAQKRLDYSALVILADQFCSLLSLDVSALSTHDLPHYHNSYKLGSFHRCGIESSFNGRKTRTCPTMVGEYNGRDGITHVNYRGGPTVWTIILSHPPVSLSYLNSHKYFGRRKNDPDTVTQLICCRSLPRGRKLSHLRKIYVSQESSDSPNELRQLEPSEYKGAEDLRDKSGSLWYSGINGPTISTKGPRKCGDNKRMSTRLSRHVLRQRGKGTQSDRCYLARLRYNGRGTALACPCPRVRVGVGGVPLLCEPFGPLPLICRRLVNEGTSLPFQTGLFAAQPYDGLIAVQIFYA